MEFFPSELIRKKRFGGEHSREEIRYLIQFIETSKRGILDGAAEETLKPSKNTTPLSEKLSSEEE